MPLTMADFGAIHVVKKICANPEIRRFLESLGFVEGEVVTVISQLGGNMIVNVKGSRVAINRGIASKILV